MSVTPAYRCPICWQLDDDDVSPAWRILRHGDAAVSWACDGHLGRVVGDMLRLGYDNEFTVKPTEAGQ